MKKVNRNELSDHFQVSLTTLDNWRRRGMPYIRRGGRGKSMLFDINQVELWHTKNIDQAEPDVPGSLSLTDERIRLTKITADRKELLLQRERGELINTERAMTLWGAVIQIIANKLEAIPVKLAPLARATSSDREAKEIIENFINEVRVELSSPDLREINKIVADQEKLKHVKTKKPIKRKSVGRQKKGVK